MKILFIIFVCIFARSEATVPESTRIEYALKFHEAFVLQSIGQSTQAFNLFLEAFRLGTNAGESSKKLQIVADLFYWYRQHGACTKLFGKQPIDREKIQSEYCNCEKGHEDNEKTYYYSQRPSTAKTSHRNAILARVPDYRSEYGTNPQQAALVRDFIFGSGEIIAGLFAICAGRTACTTGLGLSMIYSGVKTVWNAGNTMWAQHESALLELKKLTDRAEAIAK